MSPSTSTPRVLLYILRRDVRLSDNPVFHSIAQEFAPNNDTPKNNISSCDQEQKAGGDQTIPPFTHLLPVYIFPANQIEVSGFLSPDATQCPYPEARSRVANIWRTGTHRAKFLAEGVWDLKESLQHLQCGSDLEIRVGMVKDVVEQILEWYADGTAGQDPARGEITGIYMTSDEATEEKTEEREVHDLAAQRDIEFKVWKDEKYFVDDDDLPFNVSNMSDLPDVYTSYRKSVEPLREQPRQQLPSPTKLPPLPSAIPPQHGPFTVPDSCEDLKNRLIEPLLADPSLGLYFPPTGNDGAESVHPFRGGESSALKRLTHLVTSGSMTHYKTTRNGMLGLDFSTKLSAYLAQGQLTARQIHWAMMDFEDGKGVGKGTEGFGKGETEGTAMVRFELLWRDYMRLCQMRYGSKMFHLHGIHGYKKATDHKHDRKSEQKSWRMLDKSGGAGDIPAKTQEAFERWRSGRTGLGLIDASNRELFLTGYTSNRARQNVASFLAGHLGIDWRIGAEWYECLLTDYDTASNWGNWQYVAGVGNDPRQGRLFNPVKQALDYDKKGEYIKTWVSELRDVELTGRAGPNGQGNAHQERLMGLCQAWRLSEHEKEKLELKGLDWVDRPLIRIPFQVNRARGQDGGRGRGRGRGGWRSKGKGHESRSFRRMGNEEKASYRHSVGADSGFAEDA